MRRATAALAACFAAMAAQPPAAQPPAAPPAVPSPLGTPGSPTPPKPTFPTVVGGKDLTAWLKELKESTDPGVRDTAVKVIPLFGPDARKPAMDVLIAALPRQSDPGVRISIIDVIGNLGADNPDEAKKITGALGIAATSASPGSVSRLHILRGLTNYGTDAAGAIPNVVSLASDPSWETRRALAYSLGRIGFAPDAKKGPNGTALNTLKNMLDDVAAGVRMEAVQSLILLGPPFYKDQNEYPGVVKPFLDAAMKRQPLEKDKGVIIWLQVLVMRYDGGQFTDANVKKIADATTAADVPVRLHAITALAMLGERAKPFVPALVLVLSTEEEDCMAAAFNALAALGPVAKAAVPDLEKIKKDHKDAEVKAAAGQVIDAINGKVPPKPPGAAAPPPPGKM